MTKRLTIALVALVALVLVAVLPVSATYHEVNNTIGTGATIYIGEQSLNTTSIANDAVGYGATQIGWIPAGSTITTTPATQFISLSTLNNAFLVSTSYTSYTGAWYFVDASGNWINPSPVAFYIKDPSVSADVWDFSTNQIITGGSVVQGDFLGIRITSNLNEVFTSNRTHSTAGNWGDAAFDQSNVDIKVKTDSGNTLTALLNYTRTNVPLTQQFVTLASWYLGTTDNNAPNGVPAANAAMLNWSTGVLDATGQNAYPAGVYTLTVESRINGMIDNYKSSGSTYTGKTVSAAGTVTVVSNTVKIEANKDSVVRSKAFSVTITGKPNMMYHLWVKGTSTMDGTYDNQPPIIATNQAGVTFDDVNDITVLGLLASGALIDASGAPTTATYAGAYVYQNHGSTANLYNNVAHGSGDAVNNAGSTAAKLGNGTYLYANVSLSDSGTRTVEFLTTNWTKAQKYTIRVEQNFTGQIKSDEVDVKVEKGAVTIVAAGDQSYYLGEEVKFSGTNTESTTTYLFITGPNLPSIGGQINSMDPRYNDVVDGNGDTFQTADVLGDNTWSWKWGTANVALDAGTYTVYAVSQPEGTDALNNVAYGTVSIIVKKPFISAVASQSTVAQGDPVYITGTAEGQPSVGVRIWILGKNFAGVDSTSVNSDASFSYELKRAATENLYAGQYFIVAQHPMQNDKFDVYPAVAAGGSASGMPIDAANGDVSVWTAAQEAGATSADDSSDFKLTGSGSLQGSDAAEALIEAINDANVDDTYTKLQILVEVPTITVDTVGDRHVGDKFTITATTNLAVDDEVLFEVYSSSFQPTTKSQSGEFSGASGTVKVAKGDGGLNKLSFDVDASTFKPDEYLVKATEVLAPQASGTALFNVLEASAPTATVTTAAVTTVAQTTVATTVPTTVATPTKTPTQPGFGALVALIGLGAVAFLVVRRH